MAEKKQQKPDASTDSLEGAAVEKNQHEYVLRLFVAGVTPRSEQAIRNVTTLCKKHLHGRFELEVIDIYQQPMLAKDEQIIAVPTLIKKLPSPLRKLIGSMMQEDNFLVGLDLQPKEPSES